MRTPALDHFETYPFRFVEHDPGEMQTCCSDLRRREGKEAVVDEGNLHEVFGDGSVLDIVVVSLGTAAQKVQRVGEVQSKVENLEDVAFGLENFFVGVASVGHVDKVLDRWRHDFFILGSDEEGGEADELKLLQGDDAQG